MNFGFPFNSHLTETTAERYQQTIAHLPEYLEQAADLGPSMGFVSCATQDDGIVALVLYSSASDPRYFVKSDYAESMETKDRAAFKRKGYEPVHTGGNCWCYGKTVNGKEKLVSDVDGEFPTPNSRLYVAWYDEQGFEIISKICSFSDLD